MPRLDACLSPISGLQLFPEDVALPYLAVSHTRQAQSMIFYLDSLGKALSSSVLYGALVIALRPSYLHMLA